MAVIPTIVTIIAVVPIVVTVRRRAQLFLDNALVAVGDYDQGTIIYRSDTQLQIKSAGINEVKDGGMWLYTITNPGEEDYYLETLPKSWYFLKRANFRFSPTLSYQYAYQQPVTVVGNRSFDQPSSDGERSIYACYVTYDQDGQPIFPASLNDMEQIAAGVGYGKITYLAGWDKYCVGAAVVPSNQAQPMTIQAKPSVFIVADEWGVE